MDTPPPEISWPQLTAFMRQHTHDVRNHLNGLDLEAALLSELVNDDKEVRASLGRLRQQIRDISMELRALSSKFAPPSASPCVLAVRDVFLIWKDQASMMNSPAEIEWRDASGDGRVSADPDALSRTFRELLENAVAFGTGAVLQAAVSIYDGHVAFVLTEPKTESVDCTAWGQTPLISTRRNHHGLGLWTMQRDVTASGGEVARRYDAKAKTLTTTLTFPAARG